jgi:hypothetical protein
VSSSSKRQGTAWERELRLQLEQLVKVPVVRLAEGGTYDRGDLALHVGDQEIVIEARDRSSMQVHTATEKARQKAGPEAVAVVAWKRKIKKPGNERRSQVGRPVAVLDLADLIWLLRLIEEGRE